MRAYIVAASDFERNAERRLRWGDYWLKHNLARALEADGWTVDERLDDATDVLIHCYGGQTISNLPAHTYNVLYIHSHPANLNGFDFRMYDRVVAGSERLAEQLRARGIEATWNIGATDFVPMDVPIEHDAVFVGNNRGGMRPIIAALGDLTTLPFKLEVWGEGWECLPAGIWQGKYIPYDELNRLYASSAVVLNDTHTDMIEAGIINPRVLDAMKAGAVVVEENSADPRADILEALRARANGWRAPTPTADWSYARLTHDLVGGIEARLRLDIGCGNHKRAGHVGIDRARLEGVDVVWDVRSGLPSHDSSVDYIVADNLMEHIGAEFIDVMNDLRRALKPSGRLTVIVPGIHSPAAAFGDPTHVRWFAPETWDYFDVANGRWHDYGQSYGIKPWAILRRTVHDRFIEVVLQPAKECAQ